MLFSIIIYAYQHINSEHRCMEALNSKSFNLYIHLLMKIVTEILGNIHFPGWGSRLKDVEVEYVCLDQWTAQKSRFLAVTEHGEEFPVALRRHAGVADGDIIYYSPEERRAVVLRIELSPVLVIDLGPLLGSGDMLQAVRRAVELGHAIGNQHWPAVVKDARVYVPLTVDRKVMLSVMETHHLEGISYEFLPGREVIPYLAPHEVRRLFGGAGQEGHTHRHGHDEAAYAHPHGHGCHKDDGCHTDGNDNNNLEAKEV